MVMNRRGFMGSILAAGVAPFVVSASSLMAVRVPTSGFILRTCGYDGFVDTDIPAWMIKATGERMALVRDLVMLKALSRKVIATSTFSEVFDFPRSPHPLLS